MDIPCPKCWAPLSFKWGRSNGYDTACGRCGRTGKAYIDETLSEVTPKEDQNLVQAVAWAAWKDSLK